MCQVEEGQIFRKEEEFLCGFLAMGNVQLVQYLTCYLVSFLIMLSLALGILTYLSLSLNLPIIADLMGYGATLIEIQLPVPQILSSYKQKSVVGVSSTMIGLWFFNDSLKTCYFIYNHQPLQFVMTGAIQLTMDIVLLTMIRLYGRKDIKS